LSNSLLVIDSADLTKLDQKQVVSLAEQASREILLKINEAAVRIEKAKDEAQKAKTMKAGWFGKTTKKADATADALVRTNEAIAEMHALIQESVRYTQVNGQLSKAMHLRMSAMVVEGFRNRDGELIHLNNAGEEFAQILLEEAETFADKQFEIETLQARQAEEIRNVAHGSEKLAEKIGQDIERLKQDNQKHAQHLKSIIVQKSDAILNRSDANDERHQKLIDGLQASTQAIRKSSDEQDRIHSEQILELQKRVADQEVVIEALRETQAGLAPKSVTYLASALSVFAIAISGFLLYQA
jgi:hypothetical protein